MHLHSIACGSYCGSSVAQLSEAAETKSQALLSHYRSIYRSQCTNAFILTTARLSPCDCCPCSTRMYVGEIAPQNAPRVLGTLLDLNCRDKIFLDVLDAVGVKSPLHRVEEEVRSRVLLSLLSWLQYLFQHCSRR